MKRMLTVLMVLAMALTIGALILPAPLLAKSVELKLWSAWPEANEPAKPALQMLQDMIKERGAAVGIGIRYVGGPEVFGAMQGIESLRRGTIDIAYTAGPYSMSIIPEADAMKLMGNKPWVDRKTGAFDLMNAWHKEKGVVYLARGGTGQQFQAYLNKEIRKPDLSGLTMRIVPIYDPLIKALGARGVSTAGGEVYTALDQGIVDGFFWGGREIRPWGWHEVVKYIWGPSFWTVDVYIAMNQRTWDALTSEQKKVLTEIMEDYEKKSHEAQAQLQSEISKTLLDGGMQMIEFSPKDTEWYLNMTNEEGWKEAVRKAGRVAELKDIIDKQ